MPEIVDIDTIRFFDDIQDGLTVNLTSNSVSLSMLDDWQILLFNGNNDYDDLPAAVAFLAGALISPSKLRDAMGSDPDVIVTETIRHPEHVHISLLFGGVRINVEARILNRLPAGEGAEE